MRDRFRFDSLRRDEDGTPLSDEAASAIFFRMLAALEGGAPIRQLETVAALAAAIAEGRYRVAHKRVSVKGKERRFAGAFAIARKRELIEYLAAAMAEGDLREMLIAPEPSQDAAADWVLHVDEDAQLLFYAALPCDA